MKTGKPEDQMEEGKDYGEGICPECGTPGKEVGDFEALEGQDEFEGKHEEAAAEAEPKIAELKQKYAETDMEGEDYAAELVRISEEAQARIE
jgi:hypothetical protein